MDWYVLVYSDELIDAQSHHITSHHITSLSYHTPLHCTPLHYCSPRCPIPEAGRGPSDRVPAHPEVHLCVGSLPAGQDQWEGAVRAPPGERSSFHGCCFHCWGSTSSLLPMLSPPLSRLTPTAIITASSSVSICRLVNLSICLGVSVFDRKCWRNTQSACQSWLRKIPPTPRIVLMWST